LALVASASETVHAGMRRVPHAGVPKIVTRRIAPFT